MNAAKIFMELLNQKGRNGCTTASITRVVGRHLTGWELLQIIASKVMGLDFHDRIPIFPCRMNWLHPQNLPPLLLCLLDIQT